MKVHFESVLFFYDMFPIIIYKKGEHKQMPVKLNSVEKREYFAYVEEVIPNLDQGIYYFANFFTGRSASPRLARYLFEQVCLNKYPHMTLVGTTSAEGYRIISKVNTSKI